MLAGLDKLQDFRDRLIFTRHRLYRSQSFREDTRSIKQLLIKRSNLGEPLAGEFAALHANDVEPFKSCVLSVDQPERNDITTNAADAAHHDLGSDPCELVDRGQAADEDEVANLTVPAQCRGSGEDDVVADLAIMSDMAAIHEVAAVADARDATTANGAGIHRYRLADSTVLTDLEFGRFTTIAQGLRGSAQGSKRIDRAAGADGRVPHQVDVPDQFAIRADDDVTANHAVRPDRRAFADHSAVFNPRGWIDRSHRGAHLSRSDLE